jgi:hypothetical protein
MALLFWSYIDLWVSDIAAAVAAPGLMHERR